MKKTTIFFFLILFLISPFQTIASTNVTSNITQNTTWNTAGSPYYIMNDIQVYENITLTIQPGVEVIFQGTAFMQIGGQIVARGTATQIISFSSNNVWDRRQSAKIGGVSFLETAPSASYKPGDRPTFKYDFINNQVLLEYDDTKGYESGSVFDYCLFDNFDVAIKASNSLPCLMNSTIRNSYYGLHVGYHPELPQYKWLFVYNNTIENCEIGISVGRGWGGNFRRGNALISGNTIKNCGFMQARGYGVVEIDGDDRGGTFLFNNQIINNASWGFYGKAKLMEHNVITHNFAGVYDLGWNALLHNYIVENRTNEYWTVANDRVLGAGVHLYGPVGMIFNNSIQLNGVNGLTTPQESHGDGIALSSSENNTFVINYNNLGNSVWDMQDLYLYANGNNCATSKLMNVDAKFNAWNVPTNNIPSHIFDQNDDMCAGMVDYLPVLSSAMIPAPLDTHPSLQSPADNTYLANTYNVIFSWSPVKNATKYMIGIFGKSPHNKLKIVNTTSVTIDFFSNLDYDYGMKVIHWFVVAGNDNGWSLPSAVRKVTFSPDAVLVTGKVRDENEIPLSGVYVGDPSPSPAAAAEIHSFSDENGNYTLIPENYTLQREPQTYLIKKRGYVPCYTYPRGQREFNIAPDLMIVSPQKRDSLYNAAGISRDTIKGDVAGVIINKNDEALIGAKVSIEPSSGVIYYLDDNKNPNPSLTNTGTTGEFVILNVTPGAYTLTATLNGTAFDTTLSVYQGSTTLDTLITVEGGDGGGGGNFVTSDLWIKAVINTEEKGPIKAVWKKGGEDTTSRGDRVIWGHFYASPSDVTWGSENNPDLFVKIWFDVSGRVDVNYFHVSVPDIEVYSDYRYDGTVDEYGTTTMSRRYIRQYYENGQSNSDENCEDGNPPSGYSPTGNPFGYSTINDLRIGSMINTIEKGPIDAVWRLGGQDTTSRGDQVVWGHFYANPLDVTWGSQNNPDLFMKIWFDVSGRVDVNFFHVSVPDIEVYSDLPSEGAYDQKGTTIMDNRYIRHEY